MQLRRCQFRSWMVRSMKLRPIGPSPLLSHVAHVVAMGTEKEMRRPNTSPVIAAMENLRTGRDRAVSQTPSYAVGLGVCATIANLAIAPRIDRSLPLPAVGSIP